MKIDKTTTAEEISRMNVVDACFSGFHYDSESHEIKFELTEEYQKTGEVKWKIKTFMKAAYW